MNKADRRANKRFKDRYGHFGAGASHTREASEAEVLKHIEKAKNATPGSLKTDIRSPSCHERSGTRGGTNCEQD